MMQGAVAREEIELSFKRYILEKTEAFAHEPMEDVYRVNLFGQMLDRYDELRITPTSPRGCAARALKRRARTERRRAGRR